MSLDQLSADQLIQYLSWAVYLLIFVFSAIRAVRRPLRTNIDIALFFSCSTIIIFLTIVQRLELVPASSWLTPWLQVIEISLLIALAYLLTRLTHDFWTVPALLMRASEIGLALIIVGNIIFAISPLPTGSVQSGLFIAVELLYLVFFLGYTSVAFVRASRRTTGVTFRRMRAVAFGSGFLVAGFLISSIGGLIAPGLSKVWSTTYDILGLASGISYYLGFATPAILRRAWQEPELRGFLSRAASLPRLPDTRAIIEEMEHGAASSVGAPRASIGLWDEEAQLLRYVIDNSDFAFPPDVNMTSGRAFLTQRPLFSPNLQRDHPNMKQLSEKYNAIAMLVAPITAGEKRLGVLAVYAPRAPIFAEDDLNLVQLLADQAAVVLESRALIDEAARVQAREEVARLKEDFLSAAAHDLKTPLTTLVAQAQLLERRVLRAPDKPVEPDSIHKMVREAQRLRDLVLELLDASRAEQGKLVADLEPVDLGEAARETCERYNSEHHPCTVEVEGEARGMYDRTRILQLMENLVENAVKYSPGGGPVKIKIWNQGDRNCFTVSDKGIGIPANDLPNLFERFHRGTNVDDRRFAGMGLGLYICRGIVEQHGGQIKVRSAPGQGTTFEVSLPVNAEAAVAEPSAIGGKIAS